MDWIAFSDNVRILYIYRKFIHFSFDLIEGYFSVSID